MAPDSCVHVPPPAYLSFFTAAISILLIAVTIPGNTLVCVAIVKDPFRELRTPFNYFLLSLAAADFLVGTLMDTISAVYHFGEGLKLALVDIRILHVAYFVLCTASILTLAALTVDRYYAVMSPLRYRTHLTPHRVLLATAVIWFVAIVSSMLYFKLGFIFYSFIFANTSVFCTTAVLCFVYSRIYQRLRKRINVWKQKLVARTPKERREEKHQWKTVLAERKATKALVLVLLAFLACFTPACAMIYMLNFCVSCGCVLVNWLRDLQFVIVLFNSGINPYIYAWRLPQFRKVFGRMVRSQRTTIRTNNSYTSHDLQMVTTASDWQYVANIGEAHAMPKT